MEKIQDALIENPYIASCQDTVFTVLLKHRFSHNTEKYKRLKSKSYIHGLLQYPHKWSAETDIFQYIKPKIFKRMKKHKWFFVFDASTEGFSPIYEFPFFDMLYYNCKKYNVDPRSIIFVSANLKDEENIINYSKEHKVKPLNVFSFLSFERVVTIEDKRYSNILETEYKTAFDNCYDQFDNKYFSSLSRVNRPYRSLATFLLCQSNIKDNALISHDTLNLNIEAWRNQYNLSEYSNTDIENWLNSLPLIADRKDFDTNWAINTPYDHIHNQTLFQIVNETLVKDNLNTSMFYSEKTFRPIAYFQPMVIYGQPGCNKFLKAIGYELYDDWFDLSFDDIEDPVIRYKSLLDAVTDTVEYLKTLNRDDQISWRFKNKEKLIHNFSVMINSKYSKNKLMKFLRNLEIEYVNRPFS